jgi:hypothetical protein
VSVGLAVGASLLRVGAGAEHFTSPIERPPIRREVVAGSKDRARQRGTIPASIGSESGVPIASCPGLPASITKAIAVAIRVSSLDTSKPT